MQEAKDAAGNGTRQTYPDEGLPSRAPELWRGVRAGGGEPLVEFFRRVWGPYLAHGLDSAKLRKFDPKLSLAIQSYKSHGNLWWPSDLELPNRRSRVRKAMELLDQGRWAEVSDRDIIAALRKRQRDAKPTAIPRKPRSPKKR